MPFHIWQKRLFLHLYLCSAFCLQILILLTSNSSSAYFCSRQGLKWNTSQDYVTLLLFSHSVVSDSSWPRGLQHTWLPCLSPLPRACSNLCPLSQWCHPTISPSVFHFSSCLQSFSASGSLLMSQLFTSGGQSIGASASVSVLQWIFRVDFLYEWLVLPPCSPRDSQESSTPQFKSINSSEDSWVPTKSAGNHQLEPLSQRILMAHLDIVKQLGSKIFSPESRSLS